MQKIRSLAASVLVADKIDAAMRLVLASFEGKYRFGEEVPMAMHSIRVGSQLSRLGGDPTTVLGGFCHDLLEDTNVDMQLLTELFGCDVANLVKACSLNARIYNANHLKGNQDLIRRVIKHGNRAIAIKVVDITDNLATFAYAAQWGQDEMRWCADQWLDIGRRALGNTQHVQALLTAINQLPGGIR